jgi:hypothetical protein
MITLGPAAPHAQVGGDADRLVRDLDRPYIATCPRNAGCRMEVGFMERRPWSPMQVTRVGTVADVLRMPGLGKLSLVGGDPGDPRKPKGHDH